MNGQIDTVELNSLVTPDVVYTWKRDHFERVQDGKPSNATDGEPLEIQNVVILKSIVTLIPGDDQGRVDVELLNDTKATVLVGGQAYEVDFHYDFSANTFSFEFVGEPFDLLPGQTWVEVIPGDATVEISDIV